MLCNKKLHKCKKNVIVICVFFGNNKMKILVTTDGGKMNYFIYGLADYIANLTYDNLSEEAIDFAKKVILDSYGNMIFGRYSETKNLIMGYLEKMDGVTENEGQVSILGEKERKTNLETAVFIHTMMSRCADLDDGYRHAMGHPGSVLVPLLVNVAELYDKNGKDMITAIVGAYDIYARLGECINPFMYRERGFDATGVCGAVAAAALVSKLKGLDKERIKDAMGIASLFSGGLIEYQNDGTSGKILCSGWAAVNGIRATKLAEIGFTGPNAAFEGKYGFLQAFKGVSGHCDTSGILLKLGEEFKITHIYFKRHACQRGLHAVLDAMLDLKEKHLLQPDEIENVEIKTSSFVYRLSNKSPETFVGAQASAQFTSAVALKYGRMDSEKLVSKSFEDKEIARLADKVTVILDDEVQDYLKKNPTHFCAAKVLIHKKSGEKYESWNPVPLGDVETTFGWDMLENKFYNLVKDTPYEKDWKDKFNTIMKLEDLQDMEMLYRY